MNIYSSPPLVGAIFCFAIGLFIFLKNKKSPTNIAFSLCCLSIFIWLSGYTLAYLTKDRNLAVFFCRLACTGAMFTAPTFYHLTISFLKKDGKEKKLVALFYGIMIAIVPFSMTSRYFLSGVYKYFWGYYSKAGLLHPLYLIIFFGIFIRAFLLLYAHYKERKELSPIKATQTKYLFIAYVIALMGAVDYIPKYGVEFYPSGFVFEIAFAVITAYAIIAHRLMDINVVITRGLAYGAITAVIAGAYIGLMAGVDKIFAGMAGYNPALAHSLLFIIVLFALIYVLPQMKIRALEMTRRALFRGRYDYQQELSEATRVIPTMLNLEQLGQYILTKIRDTMLVDKLALFVYDEAEHIYYVMASLGLDKGEDAGMKIGENSPLAGLLRAGGKPLLKEELQRTGTTPEEIMPLALEQLESLGAELCIPLMLKEDLAGILTLSNKRSGEMFTDEDLSLFAALTNQVALAIEYIRAIDKISSEKRYVGLGKAAMRMAHDIKNPLVPLKTFLQILPDKYPKEFSEMAKIDAEFTGRFYQSALEGVDRINHLIERALHYSRHPQPQFAQVDLVNLLEDVLIQEEVDLKKTKVQVQKQYDPAVNGIEADGEQLIELFSNLISNSIDAMEEAPQRILTVKTQIFDSRVLVEIIDSGCGIPKDKISSIFDPFITYKHQGSGLGLAIAKKIVDDHRGTIEVNSEPEKGTRFKVTLPRKQ